MSSILTIFTLVAQMCPLMLAADCTSHPELCKAGNDETSLMQIRKSLSMGTQPDTDITQTVTKVVVTEESKPDVVMVDGDPEPVDGNFSIDNASAAFIIEHAQDDLKAAQSNTSILMYAHSVAKLNYAKASYAAAKAAAKAEGATLKEVKAERAAALALQAATDEAAAWKVAVTAESDAQTQAEIAEADAAAKHVTLMNATAAAANASAARQAAEDASAQTKIVQQQLVDDAAAEASAVYAHNAKVAAAAAAAADRQAQAAADAMNAAEKEAAKKAWQEKRAAWHNEWHAVHKSAKAQAAAIAAMGAGTTGDLVAKVANITALMNLTALIQQPAAVIVENDTMLDVIAANASAAVNAAEELVSETASDEKKAKAALDVAKYAADASVRKLKVSESKADSAYAAAMAAMHHADKMAREAHEAEQGTIVAEWELGHASASNITAAVTVPLAENATYNTAADVRNAKDLESAAAAAVKTFTDAAMREKIIDAYVAADADATDTANIASASRIVSDYGEWEKADAVAAAENATDYLKIANADYKESLKLSNTAESKATHTADQAQKFDKKAAATTLDSSVNTTAPQGDAAVVSKTVVVSSSSNTNIPR